LARYTWAKERRSLATHSFAVQPILRGQYEAIEGRSKSRCAVVVANCLGFGARIAQEKLGVPLVTAHLQPAAILSRVEPPTFAGVVGPRWLRNGLLRIQLNGWVQNNALPRNRGLP